MANSSGGNSRATRAAASFPIVVLSAMNRVAAPETRNSRVSRQGLVISMKGISPSTMRGDFTCQSHGT